MSRPLRNRLDRIAERFAQLRPAGLTDAQLVKRVEDFGRRAEAGDVEAVRRFERVQAILDRARARMAAEGDS